MALKVARNRKLDVAYVQLRRGKVSRTVEVRPGILLDLDRKGGVLGIEVMSLSTLAPVLQAIPGTRRSGRAAAA